MANQLCRNSQRSPEPTWKKGEGNSAFNRPRWTGKYEAGSERKAALCMSDTSSLHPLNRRSRLLTKYSARALVPRFTGISYPVKHGLVPSPKSRSRNPGSYKKTGTENVDMNLKMRQLKIAQDLNGRGGEGLMEGTMNFFSRSPSLLDFPSSSTSFSLALLD